MWEWESLLPNQMSTGGWTEGRVNGTKNAVLILISAHVGEKTAKMVKLRAVNVKGERKIFDVVQERSVRGKVGDFFFAGQVG